MDTYKKSGSKVRCMTGRYGEYVLIDDLQKLLYRDAIKLANQRKDAMSASTYAVALAEQLDDLKN